MVRLDRITMQGFKSFANKVTIPFPAGFNCIAGPNGSGKSNVVDAITFVLGTSSARDIRAQKLQNLLFNGAKSKKPADHCEVTLYIDNTDKSIPNMEEEVKITRRITRSGISVYKLNGMTVTRTKILDLLANAKLSPEGYNIIMQGDVTRIIEMSLLERRGIIDEIAGIAEFDEKKEKAARELERVDILVRESMIVVAEKQRLVARLKAEKESAEKYQKLSDELKLNKASLLHARMKDVQFKTAAVDKTLAGEAEKFSKHEKDFGDIEKITEEKEKLIRSVGDEVIQKSKNYELVREIDKIQTDIIRKRDKIDVNSREVSRLQASSPVGNYIVNEVMKLNLPGVYGTFYSLINIPPKYAVALEVAIGRHRNDVVVDTDETAAACIKALKERKIGRARFIPLNKIRGREKKPVREKIIGYAIDLIKFDAQFGPAVRYVLGSTLVVEGIDTARRMRGHRIVTLDGDLVEPSGAMIGGYYKKMRSFSEDIEKLRRENELLETEIEKARDAVNVLKAKEQQESEEVTQLQKRRDALQKELEELRKSRKDIYEMRLVMQGSISKLRIEKAKLEAEADSLKLEFDGFADVKDYLDLPQQELQSSIRDCIIEINNLGPINMRAIEEYGMISVEFDEMKKKLDKLLQEKDAVTKTIAEVETRRRGKFMETLSKVSENFTVIYRDLTNGVGRLRLESESIDSGLVIEASPAGKNIVNLDAMSGGEKTLTSLAFLFAIMQLYYSPFYVLDEVDAALDKANTKKIIDVIKKYSKNNQFIVISHNDFTLQEADKVFGVSMEDGASKIFGIELPRE